MRRMMHDPQARLLRAIRAVLAGDARLAPLLGDGEALPALVVEGLSSEPWASTTFTGYRHRIDLRLRVPAAELAAARLAVESLLCGAEFDLPGQLVADIALTGARTVRCGECEALAMTFEALTVTD